jgi:hypothetical protein
MQNTASRSGATQPHARQGRAPNTSVEWIRSSAPRRRFAMVIAAQSGLPEYRNISLSHKTSLHKCCPDRAANSVGHCPTGMLPKVDGRPFCCGVRGHSEMNRTSGSRSTIAKSQTHRTRSEGLTLKMKPKLAPQNVERDLSKLVNLRTVRKSISDARTATFVILSIGSGPGGRRFKSFRPRPFT